MPDLSYLFIILNYKENHHEKVYGMISKMPTIVCSLHNLFIYMHCIRFTCEINHFEIESRGKNMANEETDWILIRNYNSFTAM